MAAIKQLKEGDELIFPLTHIDGVVDSTGNKVIIPTKMSELSNDNEYITKADVKDVISSLKTVSVDFGNNEDSVSLVIMDSNVSITDVKLVNVSNLYISYGDVIKEEFNGDEIDLGNSDFIILNIVRNSDSINAAVGLTFKING